MSHQPTLTLVKNCGSLIGASARRRRRLRVKPLVHSQLSSGENLKLVGPSLGNDLIPLRDRALRDAEGFGKLLASPEVIDGGLFSHAAARYSMLNPQVKDGKPDVKLSCLGMDTMGSRIKTLRISKGLTQQALADAVGVTKGAVSQWEAGDIANPKLHTVLTLCEELGTDIAYLVYGPTRRPAAKGMRVAS